MLAGKNGPWSQVVELIKNQIENSSSNVILIDGIRSNDEIEVLENLEM